MSASGHRAHGRRPGRRAADWVVHRLTTLVGGPARLRVVGLLAAVLALNSADTATVGATAGQLEASLHIDNTELGLLVSLPAFIGALATLPTGVLTDRVRRTTLLGGAVALWSAAQLVSGVADGFSMLLITRLVLGAITAAAGPAVASLTGDFFPARERGRIYGFILSGELIGAGIGFVVSGDLAAALSWRFAFVILALPGFALAWALFKLLPEPARGGQSRLEPGARRVVSARQARQRRRTPDEEQPARDDDLVQEEVRHDNVHPNPDLVLHEDPARMSLPRAVRYVLSVRTNPILIVSSSLGYFFLSGLETFAVVFAHGHFGISHAAATSLLGLLGVGAVLGILIGGRLADWLVRRGHLNGRITVPAVGFLIAAAFLVPGFVILPLAAAIPFLIIGGFGLSAPNPPLDAARLDIMHSRLWGRAESVRTLLRQIATALAPVLFGFISDELGRVRHGTGGLHGFGAGASAAGLQDTFLIMLVPLAISGLILFRALRTYPQDVATAMVSEENVHRRADAGVRRRSEQRREARQA